MAAVPIGMTFLHAGGFPRWAPSPARGFGRLKTRLRSPSFECPERSAEIVSRFFGNNQRIRSGLFVSGNALCPYGHAGFNRLDFEYATRLCSAQKEPTPSPGVEQFSTRVFFYESAEYAAAATARSNPASSVQGRRRSAVDTGFGIVNGVVPGRPIACSMERIQPTKRRDSYTRTRKPTANVP